MTTKYIVVANGGKEEPDSEQSETFLAKVNDLTTRFRKGVLDPDFVNDSLQVILEGKYIINPEQLEKERLARLPLREIPCKYEIPLSEEYPLNKCFSSGYKLIADELEHYFPPVMPPVSSGQAKCFRNQWDYTDFEGQLSAHLNVPTEGLDQKERNELTEKMLIKMECHWSFLQIEGLFKNIDAGKVFTNKRGEDFYHYDVFLVLHPETQKLHFVVFDKKNKKREPRSVSYWGWFGRNSTHWRGHRIWLRE